MHDIRTDGWEVVTSRHGVEVRHHSRTVAVVDRGAVSCERIDFMPAKVLVLALETAWMLEVA